VEDVLSQTDIAMFFRTGCGGAGFRRMVSNRGRQKVGGKIKAFLSIADHSIARKIKRGTGMTFDVTKLLRKCRKRIARGLAFTSTSAQPSPLENTGLTPQNGTSEVPAGTIEDAAFQHPQWDLFFDSLREHSNGSGDNGHAATADAEDVTHLFHWNATVESLITELDMVPDIRQPRVDSLKRAVAQGRYRIDPHQIALAMLADERLNLR
jgi:flagellar biosynthesis anti-sigma factor FlgM